MFHLQKEKEKSAQELKGDEDIQFCWGQRKGGVTLYESFTLDDIIYTLYDCVYMWRDGQDEPDIGKLVKIWETESHEKQVEVVWFFRPVEISNWLGDIKPLQREIFLACGNGKGLSNISPLEAISGKCNVVCSSKHSRNPQPTEEELRMADYIFYRTFDVVKCIISESFPRSIGGIEVHHFFNMRKDAKLSVVAVPKAPLKVKIEETSFRAMKNDQTARFQKVACSSGGPYIPASRPLHNPTNDGSSSVAKVKYSERFSCDVSTLKKRKLLAPLAEGPRDTARPCPPFRDFGHEKGLGYKDSCTEKKDLYTRASFDEKARNFTEKGVVNKQPMRPPISYKHMEVTRKPGNDSSKWFKLGDLNEEMLHEMNEKGTLVLLENFEPTFTAAEVEDIVWCVFEQRVKAKMVQQTKFSSPHYGQAFASFRTKEAADYVLSQLTNGCLVLGDGRPIVGRRRYFGKMDVSGGFAGHLNIDRARSRRQREEIRNAVATSHFSQSNTIEYTLALQWRLLQEKSELWWTSLREEQGKEIEALMKEMKIPDLES